MGRTTYLSDINNKLIKGHSAHSTSLYKPKMTDLVTLSNKFIGRRHHFFQKVCEREK